MNRSYEQDALKTFIRDCVSPLADEKSQNDAWLEGQWDKLTTIDELYINFCDYCEPILENPDRYNLSSEQLSETKRLYDLIESFDEKNPEIETIEDYKKALNDPLWKDVQIQAKVVLSKFQKSD
ncbi:MAG: hypothetical protein KDK71_05010 [Chlamydiia bacterium]|nr:hypothetical protein [Chlamydiia bacterium]